MSPLFNLATSDAWVTLSIAITTSPTVAPIVVPAPAYVLFCASVMFTFILTVSYGESIVINASLAPSAPPIGSVFPNAIDL